MIHIIPDIFVLLQFGINESLIFEIMYKLLFLSFFTFYSVITSAQNYTLKWEDNFDAPVLNETSHWKVEVNGDGGGNNEMQYYRRENIAIENYQGVNCLVISAKKESFGGKLVTSGRLTTQTKISAKYGKIEARIKLPPTANGLWPAFWMMGEDISTVGWPRCGETDILEMGSGSGISKSKQDRLFNGACHYGETHAYYAQENTAAYSLQDDFHLYTLIWDENFIMMYLDLDKYPNNPPYYLMSIGGVQTIGQQNYYFHKPFFILFNLAVGGSFTGITGNSNVSKITALADNGTPAKMYIDYVRIYQKGDAGEEYHGPTLMPDTEKPTSFTATKAAVTYSSVELLLNATDNSGSVYYTVSYDNTSFVVNGTSGVQTSTIIRGLSPSTLYNFSIVVKDGSGNTANNPISLSATTSESINTACSGTETAASQGSFTLGYNYSFETAGTDVNVNFELLDNKTGLVGYLWNTSSGFVETLMTKTDDKKFSVKLMNITPGTTLQLACKFAFAGGMSVTKVFNYTVGTNCPQTSFENPIVKNDFFYPNPVQDILHINLQNENNQLLVYDLIGNMIIDKKISSSYYLDMSSLKSGVYFIKVKNNFGAQTGKLLKQ